MESQSVRCQARLRRDGGPRRPAEVEEDRGHVPSHQPRLSNSKWALEQIRANMNYGSVLKQPAGQVCL